MFGLKIPFLTSINSVLSNTWARWRLDLPLLWSGGGLLSGWGHFHRSAGVIGRARQAPRFEMRNTVLGT